MMDATMKGRLRWKERQLNLPLVLTLAGVALVAAISMIAVGSSDERVENYLLMLSLIAACVGGLALGVMPFTPERENGTDQWLAMLPVADNGIGRVKLFQSVIYFGAYYLLLAAIVTVLEAVVHQRWIVARLFSGTGGQAVWVNLLIPLECFLWGTFAAQRSKSSLHATLAAAGLSVASMIVATFAADWIGVRVHESNLVSWTLPVHLLMIAALVAGVWQGSRQWLNVGPERTPAGATGWVGRRRRSGTRDIARPAYRWTSLIWQTWLQQRGVYLVAVLMFACFALLELSLVVLMGLGDWQLMFRLHGFLFATALGGLLGLSTFASDQMGDRYQFFQQRGGFPRSIWCTRMLGIVVATPCLIVLLWLLGLVQIQLGSIERMSRMILGVNYGYDYSSPMSADASFWIQPVLVFLAVAGVSQLISILIRSGVAMLITGILVGAATGIWTSYVAMTGEPWWLIAAPWIALTWWASAWYAPRWITGGRAWSSGLIAAALVTMMFAGSTWYLQHRRLAGVEDVAMDPALVALYDDYDETLRTQPDRFAGALQLQQALAGFRDVPFRNQGAAEGWLAGPDRRQLPPEQWPKPFLKSFVEDNAEPIQQMIAALRQPGARFFTSPRMSDTALAFQIREAIDAQAVYQLRQVNRSKALEALVARIDRMAGQPGPVPLRYWVQWLELPGQTPATLREGLERLEQSADAVFQPDSNPLLAADYFRLRRMLEGRLENYIGGTLVDLGSPIPSWELERARRRALGRMLGNKSDWPAFCKIYADQSAGGFVPRAYLGLGREDQLVEFWPEAYRAVTIEQAIRALRYLKIRFGLAIYRAETGAYPTRLQSMEGVSLDRVPVDPTTGRDFAYHASGSEEPVISTGAPMDPQFGSPRTIYERLWTVPWAVPAGQPLVLPWSGTIDSRRREFVLEANDDREPSGQDQAVPAARRQYGLWIQQEADFALSREDAAWLRLGNLPEVVNSEE